MIQSSEGTFSGEKTRKTCRETVLAQSIEILYKSVTFLLIKKKSSGTPDATSLKQTAFKVFSYFIHVFLSLTSGRFLLLFINDDVRKKENIILAFTLGFHNTLVTCSLLYRMIYKDGFVQLRGRLLNLELYLEDEKKLTHLTQQLKIHLIVQLTMYPFFSILAMASLILLSDENSALQIYFSYPIPVEGDANLTVSMLCIIFYIVGATLTKVISIITTWLIILLRIEFDCLAESFRRYFPQVHTNPRNNSRVTERDSRIFEIYEAHDNLCGVLESTNFLCRIYLGFALSFTIANTCLLAYEIIHRSMGILEFGYFIFIEIYTLSEAFLYLKEGIKLNLSAHQLTDDFYRIDLRHLSVEASLKVSIFLTRLTSSPIGISVAGLFVIDCSTILMLTGTLLTYIVVVIQTKTPENPYCNNTIAPDI